jgi:hypothetical protein
VQVSCRVACGLIIPAYAQSFAPGGRFNAMAQNSLWTIDCRERLPAFHESLELRVRLLGRTRVEPEPSSVGEHALLLLQEFVVIHQRDSLDRFGERAGAGDEFPRTFPQHETFGRADLAGGDQ